MNRPPLTIGVTTYNRRALLEVTAASLAQVEQLDQAQVLVMDDCSQEYDAGFLKQLFPRAHVVRAERHSGGAGFAMHRLLEYFVQHGSGYLLSLDSEVVPCRHLIDRCFETIQADRASTQRCLCSLFDTHWGGPSGTLWEHGLVSEVLDNVPVSRSFRSHWCTYLARQGIPIRVAPGPCLQCIESIQSNIGFSSETDHPMDGSDAHYDRLREELLHQIAEQNARLDRQSEAIVQLSRVIQSQGKLLNEVISEVLDSRVT